MIAPGRPSPLRDEDSRQPVETPQDERVLRRAMDAATLDLIRGAATAPVQLAQLAAGLDGLRLETREGLARLDMHAVATESQLRELVTLQREANAQRAQELQAREEAARWWRSLVTPQGVLYVVVIVASIAGGLLGLGQLVPPPKASP